MSLAMGIFIGIIPAWGFQTIITISLAVALRWNKALAFLGSNISIPPFIPIIVFLALQIGTFVIPSAAPIIFKLEHFNMELIKIHLLQYIVGSFLLAIFASISIGSIFYLMLKFHSRKTKNNV